MSSRRGSISASQEVADAISAAVCTARRRGLARIAVGRQAARAWPRARACAVPRTVSGGSARPRKWPWTLSVVSPCLTKRTVVAGEDGCMSSLSFPIFPQWTRIVLGHLGVGALHGRVLHVAGLGLRGRRVRFPEVAERYGASQETTAVLSPREALRRV